MADGSNPNFDAALTDADDARGLGAKLRSFAKVNPRFAPDLARTMLAKRDHSVVEAFNAHSETVGYEFTSGWASNNIPFVTPLLRDFAAKRGDASIRYLEIGAYEGRNLAVEPRFARNMAKTGFRSMTARKGFSTYELPKMLAAGEQFDLIYVDGSHTALAVLIDLCFCASLLSVGGMMVLDDYWHDISEIGGPGVKQAVDQFHAAFGRYFEITAVYRQVALTKIAEIPR